MRVLRVAVWGLGPHAIKNILPALSACPGLDIAGVCSRNADVVARIATEHSCAGWNDPATMLTDPAVDCVYLATPIGVHASHARMVLAAKKHLWCEKPLAESGTQAATLVAMSRDKGVSIAEGFMYLYHSQFAFLRETLNSGRLGLVQSISLRFGIPPLERPGFRNDPTMGGGAFLDVGSYPISAIAALFADADPEVLFATISAPPESAVDTEGRAVLRYSTGVHVALEWRVNSAYRSDIDFWGTLGSMSSERIFSKPADYIPRFRFLDVRGNERNEAGEAGDHFLAMFNVFLNLVDDSAAAERERRQVERRARLAEMIRLQSTHQE